MSGRPLHILMTVDAVGGVWQYALGLARELSRLGDRVVLAGLGPPPFAAQREEAESVAPLIWLESPPCWMAESEIGLRPLRDELHALTRRYDVDLAHLNEPAQAAGLELPCPMIAVSHSCIGTWFRAVRKERPPAKWIWHEERTGRGMHNAGTVVAPSFSHARAIVGCYGEPVRRIVVHNGAIPLPRSRKRENIVFAAARWWDRGKNGAVLDNAAGRTAWPVLAAGATAGPNGDAFSFRSAISLGPLPHMQIQRWASRAGMFVSPSLYEPFGLAALEAASAGTPLLLADIPTYRELWSDAAIFFPPHDADALAQSVNLLAADKRKRRALGAAAMQRARSYDLPRQAAAMRSVYHEALAIHAGGR